MTRAGKTAADWIRGGTAGIGRSVKLMVFLVRGVLVSIEKERVGGRSAGCFLRLIVQIIFEILEYLTRVRSRRLIETMLMHYLYLTNSKSLP